MVFDCPMTEDCPGWDRDGQVCLVRPDDCEFSPADGEPTTSVEAPGRGTPGTSVSAEARVGFEGIATSKTTSDP